MRNLLLLLFIYNTAFAQQKESTVSISCYTNPELYIQASVIAQVTDKAGKVSCKGKYVSIHNKSKNAFYYKINTQWVMVKPQGKTVILAPGANNASSNGHSVVKLKVKYKPDASGGLSAKLRTISEMNAQTDKVKASELENTYTPKQEKPLNKPSGETIAKVDRPEPSKTSVAQASPAPSTKVEPTVNATPKTQESKPESVPGKKVVAKTKPKTPAKPSRQASTPRKQTAQNAKQTSATSVGLRIDFGSGGAGLGPTIKHKFNRKLSLDAAVLFFEEDRVGLGAQVEQSFPVKDASGLNVYIGIGPQFLFGNENNAVALVPVTGLEYNIPKSPLNFSFDWRPNFYLAPDADVQAGRFGLSLRIAF